jgi:hypothetical protein
MGVVLHHIPEGPDQMDTPGMDPQKGLPGTGIDAQPRLDAFPAIEAVIIGHARRHPLALERLQPRFPAIRPALLRHPWIEPALEFRMIDYNEPALPKNDYRATILTFKLTKRWSIEP